LGRPRKDGLREPNGRLKRAPRHVRRLRPWLKALGQTGRIYLTLLNEEGRGLHGDVRDPGRRLLNLSRCVLDRTGSKFDVGAYVTGASYFIQNAETGRLVRRGLAELERLYDNSGALIEEWSRARLAQTKGDGRWTNQTRW
jgi:hypothetical protein